jgi:hypothetical protein
MVEAARTEERKADRPGASARTDVIPEPGTLGNATMLIS